jgi:hypothetical protein
MNSALSPWPRRAAFAYVTLVFLVWVVAIAFQFWKGAEVLVVAIGLPWSILPLGGGPFALFGLFLTGIFNAAVLYLLLGGWRRVPLLRRRKLTLPPAA